MRRAIAPSMLTDVLTPTATFALDPGAATALRELFTDPERIGATTGAEALDQARALARALTGAPAADLALLGQPGVGLAQGVDPRALAGPTQRPGPEGTTWLIPLRAPLLPSGAGASRVFGAVAAGPLSAAPVDVDGLARHVATVLVASAAARAADHDPLTGLLARPAFERALPAVTAALAHGGRAAALVLDVDGLREVNAARGHRDGDDLLRTLGAALRAEAGPHGLACRHGGDELVLVLPGATGADAVAVADRLGEVARALPGAPTLSAGAAEAQGGAAALDAEGLVRRADAALGRAKALGRGRREVWSSGALAPARRAGLADVLTGDAARDRRLVQALLDAVAAVSRLRPLDEALVEIVDRSIELAAADRGLVVLREGGAFVARVARGRGGQPDGSPASFATSVVEAALAEGRAVHRVVGDDGPSISPSAEALGLRAVLCAPLSGPDVPEGALYVDSTRAPGGAFDPAVVAFFDALGAQATVALRNATLYGRERERAARAEAEVVGRDEELVRVRLRGRERRPAEADDGYAGLLGRSPALREVFATLHSLEGTLVPVVIEGESGTGKELAARAIHARSPRKDGPLVTLNCAAIPDGLVESELFGHVRGAFTGALADRKGMFVEASGGTLFLDEVGELPLEAQAKLLRALQQGEVRPVGASEPRRVDVRVIAATNRDLRRMVAEGGFREDLYYRLAVFRLELPPLRRRAQDVPLLVEHALAGLGRRGARSGGITEAALAALGRRRWPGNVRELHNVLERATALAGGGPIDLEHLGAEEAGDLPAGVDGHLFELPMKTAKTLFAYTYARRAIERAEGAVPVAAAQVGVTRQTLYRVVAEGERALEDLAAGRPPPSGDEE